jgi:hypothetical protein
LKPDRALDEKLIRRDLTLAQRAKLISPAASLPRHRYFASTITSGPGHRRLCRSTEMVFPVRVSSRT